jgi:hypothetical protein
MHSKNDAQAEQILEEARRHVKRHHSWEERLHPQLLALEKTARRELLERARVEASASVHLLWQLILGVSVCLVCVAVLQTKLGAPSGGLGFASGWVVVMFIRHWHLYRATREQLRQVRLFERAARGEA